MLAESLKIYMIPPSFKNKIRDKYNKLQVVVSTNIFGGINIKNTRFRQH
jgi:hypothetical protein